MGRFNDDEEVDEAADAAAAVVADIDEDTEVDADADAIELLSRNADVVATVELE